MSDGKDVCTFVLQFQDVFHTQPPDLTAVVKTAVAFAERVWNAPFTALYTGWHYSNHRSKERPQDLEIWFTFKAAPRRRTDLMNRVGARLNSMSAGLGFAVSESRIETNEEAFVDVIGRFGPIGDWPAFWSQLSDASKRAVIRLGEVAADAECMACRDYHPWVIHTYFNILKPAPRCETSFMSRSSGSRL